MSDEPQGELPSGSGAAAVLAAAIGGFTLGVLALTADAFPELARLLDFRNLTGPLSGVTDLAIIVWLVAWLVLSRRWRGLNPNLLRVNLAAAVLLIAAVLLTFPPFMDLLQGK